MGQPYFQVSFNESQVYLGHFTLKVSFHQGTAPPVSSQWAASRFMSCVHQVHFLCFNFPNGPPPKFVSSALAFPYGSWSLQAEALKCGSWTSDGSRHSLWCVGPSIVMGPAACSAEHTHSRGWALKMTVTKHIWELLRTVTSSWKGTVPRIKILLNFL